MQESLALLHPISDSDDEDEDVAIYLSLRQRSLSFLPGVILNSATLLSIDLSYNLLTSLKGLSSCKSLRSLSLYFNRLDDVTCFRELSGLRDLGELDTRLNPYASEDGATQTVTTMLVHLRLLDGKAVSRRGAIAAAQTSDRMEAAAGREETWQGSPPRRNSEAGVRSFEESSPTPSPSESLTQLLFSSIISSSSLSKKEEMGTKEDGRGARGETDEEGEEMEEEDECELQQRQPRFLMSENFYSKPSSSSPTACSRAAATVQSENETTTITASTTKSTVTASTTLSTVGSETSPDISNSSSVLSTASSPPSSTRLFYSGLSSNVSSSSIENMSATSILRSLLSSAAKASPFQSPPQQAAVRYIPLAHAGPATLQQGTLHPPAGLHLKFSTKTGASAETGEPRLVLSSGLAAVDGDDGGTPSLLDETALTEKIEAILLEGKRESKREVSSAAGIDLTVDCDTTTGSESGPIAQTMIPASLLLQAEVATDAGVKNQDAVVDPEGMRMSGGDLAAIAASAASLVAKLKARLDFKMEEPTENLATSDDVTHLSPATTFTTTDPHLFDQVSAPDAAAIKREDNKKIGILSKNPYLSMQTNGPGAIQATAVRVKLAQKLNILRQKPILLPPPLPSPPSSCSSSTFHPAIPTPSFVSSSSSFSTSVDVSTVSIPSRSTSPTWEDGDAGARLSSELESTKIISSSSSNCSVSTHEKSLSPAVPPLLRATRPATAAAIKARIQAAAKAAAVSVANIKANSSASTSYASSSSTATAISNKQMRSSRLELSSFVAATALASRKQEGVNNAAANLNSSESAILTTPMTSSTASSLVLSSSITLPKSVAVVDSTAKSIGMSPRVQVLPLLTSEVCKCGEGASKKRTSSFSPSSSMSKKVLTARSTSKHSHPSSATSMQGSYSQTPLRLLSSNSEVGAHSPSSPLVTEQVRSSAASSTIPSPPASLSTTAAATAIALLPKSNPSTPPSGSATAQDTWLATASSQVDALYLLRDAYARLTQQLDDNSRELQDRAEDLAAAHLQAQEEHALRCAAEARLAALQVELEAALQQIDVLTREVAALKSVARERGGQSGLIATGSTAAAAVVAVTESSDAATMSHGQQEMMLTRELAQWKQAFESLRDEMEALAGEC